MRASFIRKGVVALAAAGALVAALVSSPLATSGAGLSFTLADVGAFGGEPSITSDSNGLLYDTTPSSGAPVYRSTDKGATWTSLKTAWTSSGDDCLATDQANALYWCNLGSRSNGIAPLQADSWKAAGASTCTPTVCSWLHGQGVIASTCSTSCSVLGVDRQWLAASIIPPATTTSQSEVVLNYHDFYGPSAIWVNISHDGGVTFGAAQDVLAGPAFTVNGVTGAITAEGYTFCSTVPAGVGIVPQGKPHAGRIIVGWIASDPPSDASGCNFTMAAAFHTLWVAYSDDNGSTWTPQQAFDGGIGHDASTPFVGFTLDDTGNPYFGFAMNHWDPNPATNLALTAECAGFSAAGTEQTHPECEYDMYVVWSNNSGATWDGGGGVIPGSAAAPYAVNAASETGTHWFPAIAAGDPGQVDVGYLLTPSIEPTDALGKVDIAGCAGPTTQNPTFPPPCPWNLYGGQSLNLTSSPSSATWQTVNLTGTPMHVGDICNLGIACVGGRTLADFIQETIDPTTGCAHIGYADNNPASPHNAKLVAANQTSGCLTLAQLNPQIPETPWAALLLPAGVLAAGGFLWIARRGKKAVKRNTLT